MVIFLSNFLALLIKVDVGGKDDRYAFGVLLVAVNVLLILAVLLTSWFAVQQSVDDSRDDENAFNVAKTMLTAEQDIAKHARFARDRRSTPPPAPSIGMLDSPQRSSSMTSWRESTSFRALKTASSDKNMGDMPSLTHNVGISPETAERMWQEGKAQLPVTR